MENRSFILPNSHHIIEIPQDHPKERIDTILPQYFRAYSRSFFQRLIDEGFVKVNNLHVTKHSTLIKAGDRIEVHFPPLRPLEPTKEITEKLDVQIVYEHAHFLIIAKPPKLTVHAPNSRSTAITLADWLVTHFYEIADVGYSDRPGIVHRLDKDTSGLLVIPRNNYAHALLSDMFKNRTIAKTYLAVVKGHPPADGSIDWRIDRHPTDRNRMTHVPYGGRESLTHYRVIEYLQDASLVEVRPVTGRTHQIRVHFAALGHPLIGDPIYGSKSKLIDRQALHAYKLAFTFEGQPFVFQKDMPSDMLQLIEALR
jgi:23S rRNA pseudouridine1911/1915/1917 synthase